MPNTVHGPFAPINVVNGTTPMNATWGNNAQTQAGVALASFNPDLLSPYVESGITCVKDGVTANQLDIASGRAYLTMTDGTVSRIDVVTDNTHTTSGATTTWHLYLQPDGTWYWSTSNAPQANSLHICDVATDGSGNISTVTDQRTINPTMFGGIAGDPILPGVIVDGPATLDTGAITTDGLGTLSLPGAAAPGAPSLATAANTTTNNYKTFLLSLTPTRYYRLDEASGATATDSSTAAQNGTYTGGGVTYNVAGALDGDTDNAVTLNGTTAYVNSPNTSLPTGNGAMTFGVWFKFSSNPASQQELMSYGTNAGSHFFIQLDLTTGGAVAADCGAGTVTSAALSTGVWHFAVLTWDGTNLKLYVDGTLIGSATPGAQTIAASGNFLRVGANVISTPTQFFAGSIDEAFFVSSALTATNISNLYTIGANGPDSLTLPGVGTYKYSVTFATAISESQAGTQATITTTTGNQKVNVSSIPKGPLGTTKRNIYRSLLGQTSPLLLATLADNTTTTYADSTPDSSLGAAPNPTSGGLSVTGAVEKVGGQPTAGQFGVPVIVAAAQDASVTVNTFVTVCSATTPNDGKNHVVRFWMGALVGAGNTNNGNVSLCVNYTDPQAGAITNGALPYINGTAVGSASFVGVLKGSTQLTSMSWTVLCAPNTSVAARYENTAAGTISDRVSATIELLN